MQSPLVSILIPSRGRHEQLLKTLEAMRSLGCSEGIEILVCDNSPTALDPGVLADFQRRLASLVYFHDDSPVDIMGNFSRGLQRAQGEFVMFIGDDDFALPSVLDAADFALNNDVDCVIYEPHRYYWASCTFAASGLRFGPRALVLSPSLARGWVNVHQELQKSARNGFLTIELLPRAYHGLVRREKLVREICDGDGHLRGGSPDISMAISLALVGTRTFAWDMPLSVYGASVGSGGGMTTSRTHVLTLEKATFLSKAFVEAWDAAIPRYWSEYTVFPASALYIHKVFGRSPVGFRLAAVYASILVNEFDMVPELKSAFRRLTRRDARLVIALLPLLLVRKLGGRLWRALANRLPFLIRDKRRFIAAVEHEDVVALCSDSR